MKKNRLMQMSSKKKMISSSMMKKDKISSMKQDLNLYLPTIVLWTLRFALIFQCYLYHSNSGMFHLIFVLFTVILPSKLTLFLSFTLMLPIYALEFILMYGMRIPVVN